MADDPFKLDFTLLDEKTELDQKHIDAAQAKRSRKLERNQRLTKIAKVVDNKL
jgi:hypothetical protein